MANSAIDFRPASITTNYRIVGTGTFETTVTINRLYYAHAMIPITPADPLTGILVKCGSTADGNIIVALYDADGDRVAQSNSTAHAGSYAVQAVPFTATYAAAAGVYFLAIIGSSATAKFITASPFGRGATADQGGFSAPATITPPGASATGFDCPDMATY
jgi:hypothetical protein